MTNDEALNLLRSQGYYIGQTVAGEGCTARTLIERRHIAVDVEHGPELWDLAQGKLTLENLVARRGRVRNPSPKQYGLLIVSESSGAVLAEHWFDSSEERQRAMVERTTLAPGLAFRFAERAASSGEAGGA